MSKFNETSTIITKNQAGHVAYKMKDKEKLISQVLTSFVKEPKFYGDNSDEIVKTLKNVIKEDAAFVAKLAIFARNEFNMRSISHLIVACLANDNNGKPYVRQLIKRVVIRPDDATEILSCYLDLFGKPIPNSLRRGIADVLCTFNEYGFAKYKSTNKVISMKDLICLCRPTPTSEKQSDLFKRVIENKLETPLTWETALSEHGNNKETWETLIDLEKVGYMALLRNLRNIITVNPSNIDQVYSIIKDPFYVKNSKQLPFRYLSAYNAVKEIGTSKVFDTLETALECSVQNLPKLSGTTIIAVDCSGSMCSPISSKSTISCKDIAMLLGLVANKMCEESIFYTFGSRIEKHCVSQNTNILETVNRASCHGGTVMSLPFVEMLENRIYADRIIVVSDNECTWCAGNMTVQKYVNAYRKNINKNLWVHAIDIQGYGTQQFYGYNTNIMSGWSEKILDFINLAETETETLIDRVEKIIL